MKYVAVGIGEANHDASPIMLLGPTGELDTGRRQSFERGRYVGDSKVKASRRWFLALGGVSEDHQTTGAGVQAKVAVGLEIERHPKQVDVEPSGCRQIAYKDMGAAKRKRDGGVHVPHFTLQATVARSKSPRPPSVQRKDS